MNTALNHALALAAQRIPVFFCNSDKTPACPRGFYAATSDPDKLTELFRQHPGPLLAVRTGAASRLDVLDLDLQHSSANDWWDENCSNLLLTRVHGTPSGGLHLFFGHVAGLRNSAGKIARGVDTRCEGGYVIWWPGAGFPVLCDAPIADWPPWLLAELMRRPKVQTVQYAIDTPLNGRRLAGLVIAIARAAEGNRNATLYWASRRIADSAREGEFAAEALVAAAVRAGLPEIEARRTVQSGLRGTT